MREMEKEKSPYFVTSLWYVLDPFRVPSRAAASVHTTYFP